MIHEFEEEAIRRLEEYRVKYGNSLLIVKEFALEECAGRLKAEARYEKAEALLWEAQKALEADSYPMVAEFNVAKEIAAYFNPGEEKDATKSHQT